MVAPSAVCRVMPVDWIEATLLPPMESPGLTVCEFPLTSTTAKMPSAAFTIPETRVPARS